MTDAPSEELSAERPASRLIAIDILRGFVMVLMSIDHASEELNAGRFFSDSVFFFAKGTPIPPAQFLTRWITHLCAPTFVFLAGCSLAISCAARKKRGDSERTIDRHLIIRGALLIVLDVAWMSWVMIGPGKILLQVLYAIGLSLLLMVLLRRLGDRALLGIAIGLFLFLELVTFFLGLRRLLEAVAIAFFFVPGFFARGSFVIAYPVLPWLGIMCLGWVLGRRLVMWRDAGRDLPSVASRVLAIAGALSIALFLVVRGANTYGNMGLLREGAPSEIVQWLHVSKYPPSFTFDALELGIMALLLAGLFRLRHAPRVLEPLRTIGQVALFYYLFHIHALALVAWVFDIKSKLGIASAYIGGIAVVLALYPLCILYRRFKAKHPRSIAQYI